MRSLSVAQMREAERRCIEDIGIPEDVLMENAGRSVFKEIGGGPVGLVCGKGNNGGDGFVTARLALLAGLDTRLVLLADPKTITRGSAVFMDVYRRLGGEVTVVENESEVESAMRSLAQCAVLVDAMLGTGVRGEVRGVTKCAIESWPKIPTVAVDVPSGMNADTGEICGACVPAETTVTFQFSKRGFENISAKEYLGRLVVADIGIPDLCADDDAWDRRRGQ